VSVPAARDLLVSPPVLRRLIADLVRQPQPARAEPVALDALTPRKREVLRLVARGLSNAVIGAELVVAPQTTKTHVGRILRKLNLRVRAQAVAAYESGRVIPGE
jgi:DNA-binding NarL/FixJ family response regulator